MGQGPGVQEPLRTGRGLTPMEGTVEDWSPDRMSDIASGQTHMHFLLLMPVPLQSIVEQVAPAR